MVANRSTEEIWLDALRSQLDQPDLTLAQALDMPLARSLLNALAQPSPSPTAGSAAPARQTAAPLAEYGDSAAAIQAAISDTYDFVDIDAGEDERRALLAVSDVVMIDGQRRLRINDAARGAFLDGVAHSKQFRSLLYDAVDADARDHEAIGNDPIRLTTAWLRCFLSGEFAPLDTAPPRELKAALAARDRLRAMRRLPETVPDLDDLGRRVGLAELLEPLRLLVGAEGGWDGTAATDRFIGREDELTRLRAFVDELRSEGAMELISRSWNKTVNTLTGTERPSLIAIVADGGLGKSTLLAKFVLDHALRQSRQFPFAYLDFDRAGIDAERPQQLLLEIARQIGLQYADAQPDLDRFRSHIRSEFVHSGDTAPSTISDPYAEFAEIVRRHATYGERAFLLVLDTMEVVQWNVRALNSLATLIEELRRKGFAELRVVVSGRAELPDEWRVRRLLSEADPIRLQPLRIGEARDLADRLGRAAIGADWDKRWSSKIAGTRDQSPVRREPLAVRVAVDLMTRAKPSRRAALAAELEKSGIGADEDFVARLYEQRILNHVRDPNAQQLAWPGLVIRRVTKEIVRELLLPVCGIKEEDIDTAFEALGNEVWMVEPDGEALRHRGDLRARTLPLMRRHEPKKFDQIARAAVDFFGQRRNRSHEDYVEWIYHRLLVGEPPEEVADDVTPPVLRLLAKAEADFPPDHPAASYLVSRTARTRLSPHRIGLLTPTDALRHLRITSASSFSFDDTAIDRVDLELAGRLRARDVSVGDELYPWARALWIKAGAWRRMPPELGMSPEDSSPIWRAHLFWAARAALMQPAAARGGFVERCLHDVVQGDAAMDRIGLRLVVQAMALARIGDDGMFGYLDAQVGRLLERTTPTPSISMIAALRTAIVFGEECRRAAVQAWLQTRWRGSGQRVQDPTMSAGELGELRRLRPYLGEQLPSNFDPARPTRFGDDETVAMATRAIEDLLSALGTQGDGYQALARVFARRSDDWIVPFGYAAARAVHARPTTDLLRQLERYRADDRDRRARGPADMLGAMLLADEAGDLNGFARSVLRLCDPHAPATDALYELLESHDRWQSAIAAIVGDDDQALPAESASANGDEPPAPGPVRDRADPQKHRWGGKAARDGRAARAVLESVEKDIFYFSVIVEATDGSPLEPPVYVHLHDSYARDRVRITSVRGRQQARLSEYNAYGVFCIGIQVKDAGGRWTALELDLADLPGLPKRFLSR